MQQARDDVGRRDWVLEFRARDEVDRWKNPLMGWTTEADTLNQVDLHFSTKQEAVDYAISQGYEYEVEEPKQKKKKVKSYADNYASRKYGFK
mmetsp:Transcript_45441/g.96722  ORF Transcript_45441/g.96722 Transcript_45441/m.96722 type:complete len:92 (+) Transcript_45441:35-310(+)